MNRLLRMIKHRWAIMLGQADTVYNDPPLSKNSLPSEWISSKVMDKDLMIFNMGYKEKYKGYVVVVTPIRKNKDNN